MDKGQGATEYLIILVVIIIICFIIIGLMGGIPGIGGVKSNRVVLLNESLLGFYGSHSDYRLEVCREYFGFKRNYVASWFVWNDSVSRYDVFCYYRNVSDFPFGSAVFREVVLE